MKNKVWPGNKKKKLPPSVFVSNDKTIFFLHFIHRYRLKKKLQLKQKTNGTTQRVCMCVTRVSFILSRNQMLVS